MKKVLLWLLIICLSGCTGPRIISVGSASRVLPEPVVIRPAFDRYSLRADLIRQKTYSYINDQYHEQPVSYHPLGFELGNGLFFDLNKNLCLDLAHLLKLDKSRDFTLKTTHYGIAGQAKKRQVFMVQAGDQLCEGKGQDAYEAATNCHILEQENGQTKVIKNDKEDFTFSLSESKATLVRRGKVRAEIKKTSNSIFRAEINRPFEVSVVDNQLALGKEYYVLVDDEKKETRVFQRRKRNNKLLYTITETPTTLVVNSLKNNRYVVVLDKNALKLSSGSPPILQIHVEYMTQAK
jgi:hypothetical protein